MDIRCRECGQKYHIPDSQIEDKRVYFNCDNCGHKTVIDKRKEKWSLFQGFHETESCSSNILEGIFHSFNLKNILFSFTTFLAISLIIGLCALIAWKNISFLGQHPFLSGFLLFILMLSFNHTLDIILYMLSRNSFSRISGEENISFSSIRKEISHNSLVIFLFSSGPVLLAGLLLLPVFAMKTDFGIVYSGIFYGIITILFTVIIFAVIFKNIMIAFAANKNRTVKSFFRNFFRFAAVENINIPVYSFIIAIVLAAMSSLIWGISSAAISGTSGILTSVFAAEGLSLFSGHDLAAVTSISGSVKAGLLLALISLFIITLFISAFMINLSQTLACAAIHIMESNPGRSANRPLILAGLITAALFIPLVIFLVIH